MLTTGVRVTLGWEPGFDHRSKTLCSMVYHNKRLISYLIHVVID